VPERVLDGSPPLRRTGIDSRGAVTVVSWPQREAIQFLDVGDPARPWAKAVVSIDVCTDVAVGGTTLGAVRS
jgi:hypothetical protein